MNVRIWGVRGTIPTPELNKLKTGGNTTCVEVITDEDMILILDAGSGIVPLGRKIVQEYADRPLPPIHIFLSHTHWDHIEGFPFFPPLHRPDGVITVYGPSKRYKSLEEVMQVQMDDAFCPINFADLPSIIEAFDTTEQTIKLGKNLKVTSKSHIHPGGAHSYRVEYKGKVFVFNTDVEHYVSRIDERVVEISKDADLMLHDAQYTDDQMSERVGWGHSTYSQAIAVAEQANVKKLGLTHHDPERTDREINALEKKAQKKFANSFFCREGMIIEV